MKTSWFPTAPILAVLAIPFGLAIYDDHVNPDRGLDRFGGYGDPYEDEYDYATPTYEEDDDYLAEEIEAEPTKMEDAFFDDVFFSGEGRSEPVLSGVLSPLTFGDARIEDQSSRLVQWSDYGETPYKGASLYLAYEENRLTEASVSFVDDGTMPERFEGKWGAPDGRGERYGTQVRVWLDEASRVSAFVDSDETSGRVVFSPYLPLEALVAPDEPRRLGIGEFPILGSGRAAVLAKYRDLVDPYGSDEYTAHLNLPRTEFASGSQTSIRVSFADNRVDALEFSLNFAFSPGGADELVELFARKLKKKPKVEDEYGETVTKFSGKPSVVIRHYDTVSTVQITND